MPDLEPPVPPQPPVPPADTSVISPPPHMTMPGRKERRAPTFDGTGPNLQQFFRDFETLAVLCSLPRNLWARTTLDYARAEDYDLWKDVQMSTGSAWTMFKNRISEFYAGADTDRKHTIADLERLCEKTSDRSRLTGAEFSEFYRKFYIIASYLKSKDRMSDREASRHLLSAFSLDVRKLVRAQLRAEDPTHHPDDPWAVSKVVEAAKIVLASSPVDLEDNTPRATMNTLPPPSAALVTSPARRTYDATPLVDPERFGNSMTNVLQQMSNMFETFSNRIAGGGPENRYNTPYTPQNRGPSVCMFCSDPSHFKRDCPVAQDYCNRGLCRLDERNLVILPNGFRVSPQIAPGRNLRERVDNWHRQNASPATGVVSSNVVHVVEATGPACDVMSSLIEEVAADVGTQEDVDELALLEALQVQTAMKIEAARKRGNRATPPMTRSAVKAAREAPIEDGNDVMPSNSAHNSTISLTPTSAINLHADNPPPSTSGTPRRLLARHVPNPRIRYQESEVA